MHVNVLVFFNFCAFIGFVDKVLNDRQSNELYAVCQSDGWMDDEFKSYSIAFQTYQNDEEVIMKYCVQRRPFTVRKFSASSETQTRDY